MHVLCFRVQVVLHLTFCHFCQNRYGTEAPPDNKPNSEKKLEDQKKLINQEKKTFRIKGKYIDRDSEYLLQENEPDVTLDQQLLEDLQKKKTDLRYIEMQVMKGRCGRNCYSVLLTLIGSYMI